MKSMEWYTEIDDSAPISQGDIIFDCPIIVPDPEFDFTGLEDISNIEMRIYTADVIVMTQACDLANDPPDTVIVAQINGLDGISWSTLSEINSGRRPAYHLISKKENGNAVMDYKIVDFTSIYSVSLILLQKQAELQKYRLRLNSPYLEFLSQRFGYFFSRIGLPINISKRDLKHFWTSLNQSQD